MANRSCKEKHTSSPFTESKILMAKNRTTLRHPAPSKETPTTPTESPRTLVIDIGATGIKAMLLDNLRRPLRQRVRRETPSSGKPGEVMDVVVKLAKRFEPFDRVAVGFPGVIAQGSVKEAPNLAVEWQGFNIGQVLEAALERPVRVANDADVQGFGAISGVGVELVITLGTGVGTSLFVDGRLVPNVELGTEKLRNTALQRVGKKRWNKRLAKFLQKLNAIFHCTRLYIGGGNSSYVDIKKLPPHVTVVSNLNGLTGGLALWRYSAEPSETQPLDLHEECRGASSMIQKSLASQ
jgi:polyphosphate glucokinase